tara:strand:+ start:1023 stop:1475 length:453 start_codon:yes stop_codon:yes gene_type:complete
MDNSIKKKIEFYCAYQERCQIEVTEKLKKLGIFGDDTGEYINHLISNDFLNEERFSECYVRGKFNNNNWGRKKIIRELESRNISTEIINKAMSEISEEDYIKKIRVLATKIINENLDTPKEKIREKIYNRLDYKGWEKELIFEEIKVLIN